MYRGGLALGNANIILWETFQDFTSISVALLNKFHNDEPVNCVSKMLIKHLVIGCAKDNSCDRYFLLYTVLFFL